MLSIVLEMWGISLTLLLKLATEHSYIHCPHDFSSTTLTRTRNVTAGMQNPFRSKRLVYRPVEDSHEDEHFIHSMQSDMNTFANAETRILKPPTWEESLQHKDYVASHTLLGVVICLAPEVDPASDQDAATNTGNDSRPTPIGCIVLTALKPDHAHHRNSYIGINIVKAHQRKGYGGEAIDWILDWGFRTAGLHRIGIECFAYNETAMALYGKLGFVLEGRKRQMLWFDGLWHDFVSYSMLEDEWRARRANE